MAVPSSSCQEFNQIDKMKKVNLTLLFCLHLVIGFAQNLTLWQKQKTQPYPGKQDDICFVDTNKGWYCNGQGKIYHTGNGGNDWSLIFEKPGTFFRCIGFIDSLRGFAGNVGTDYFPNVTDTIPVYQTIDGGKSWQPVNYSGPYVKGLCALDIVKEQFINQGSIGYRYHIFGVGRVGSPANILVSHDDGKTFTSRSMNGQCKMLFDIKMFNKKEGFVCAATDEDITRANALIMQTVDGGKTWQKRYQSARPFETCWKINFPTRKVGYATIQSYNPDTTIKLKRIVKTTDGGATWHEFDLCNDPAAMEFGIGFINALHGFVGTLNTGYETTNGGQTWNKVNFGRAVNKIRVYHFNKMPVLYAIGMSVYTLKVP